MQNFVPRTRAVQPGDVCPPVYECVPDSPRTWDEVLYTPKVQN